MLPFFFIPNKNRLFLLYSMLKATYKNNTYTFYVTLKDAEQYKNNGSFPNPPVGTKYLFKFTNDMSGAVKWAYGYFKNLNDRYATLELYNSTLANEDVELGKINFAETGYWKYEIYWMFVAGVTPASCNVFNPLERGTWECTNSVGTVIDSGNLDVENYEITGLDADTYTIKEYSTCNPPPFTQPSTGMNTLTQTLSYNLCTSGTRDLLFTKVVRNIDTCSFHITSKAHIGFEIRFENIFRTYSHILTSDPEDVVMEISTGNVLDDADPYAVYLYDAAGVLVRQYNSVYAMRKPTSLNGGEILASNNHWEDTSCGSSVALGSIIFSWENTGNSPNAGYITQYQAPLEIGKLLVEEPQGEEQVRYKQHESPNNTNYIYND